jgi:pimeloyl-ACP methyl ester carboxylesterase
MTAAEDLQITAPDGRSIGARIRGDRDARPLLYLHGQPGARLEADITLPDRLLAEHGFYVVSVDRPGYGLSDPAPVDDMTPDVRDLVAVCDRLGLGAVAVMGFSAGCPYALALAAGHPDRVGRVVLGSLAGPQDDDAYLEGMEPDQLEEIRLLRTGRIEEVEESYAGIDTPFLVDPVAELTSWFATFSEEEREWFRDPRVSAAFAMDARESVRQGVRGWLRESLVRIQPWSFDLGSIHAPVRAFHGELDTYEPLTNAQRVVEQLPNAQLRVYPGTNHLGPMMHPEDLLGACDDDARSDCA